MKLNVVYSVAIAAFILLPTVLATPPRVVEDPADAEIGPLDVLAVWLASDGQHLTVTTIVRDLSQPDPVAHGLDYYHIVVTLNRAISGSTTIDLHAEVYLQETSHRDIPNARYVDTDRTFQIPSSPGTYAWLHTGPGSDRYYLQDVDVRFDPASSSITWTVPYSMMRQHSVFAPNKVMDEVFKSNQVLRGPVGNEGNFVETLMSTASWVGEGALTVDSVVSPTDYRVTLK